MEGSPKSYTIEKIETDPFIQKTDRFYECVATYADTLSVLSDMHPDMDSDVVFDLLYESQKDLVSSVHECATAIIEKTIKMDERVDLITGLFVVADAAQAEYSAKITKKDPEVYIREILRRYIENAYLPQNPRKFVDDVADMFAKDFEELLFTLYKTQNPRVFYDPSN